MAAAADILHRSPADLAALIRSGDVSSRELVEGSLERIDALNPRFNAFTTVDGERALAAADDIGPGDERAFAGVPIAIKDLAASVAGMPQANGSDLFGDYTPGYDAYVVRRIKEAGFVIVGVTNTPEFGILPVTEPRRFGPARNPWDDSRTPGGSSGGAAAAVAAGMVPIAHGSDGGGSIRIPAACCGLVGLKPARGRISRGPDLGEHFLATDGVLSRTVAETARMLDLMAGYETGDATWAPPPDEPFATVAAREPGRLRVAVATESPIGSEVDPGAAGAATEAGELLASLGHEVEQAAPPWDAPTLLPLFTGIWSAGVGFGVAYGGMIAGRDVTPEDIEPLSWELYQQGLGLNSLAYLGAMAQLQAYSRGVVGFFSDYDVLLTPSLGERPVPIGTIDSQAPEPMSAFARSADFTPFTAIFNLTGQPAISVPLLHGDDGLPLGVQIAGPPAGEGLLLSLASQLEAARPWADRRPDLPA